MPEAKPIEREAPEPRTVPMSNAAAFNQQASQTQTAPFDSELSGDDLFLQLRKRLAEADRQSKLYHDAQQEIDRLRVELSRLKAQTEAEIAQARKERDEAIEAISELKARICSIVADD